MNNTYLSDDEPQEVNDYDDYATDEEYDPEVRDLIFSKTIKKSNDDLEFFTKNTKPKNTSLPVYSLPIKKSINPLPTMSANSITSKKEKRHFNPRLPPYLSIKKDVVKNDVKLTPSMFPKLGR